MRSHLLVPSPIRVLYHTCRPVVVLGVSAFAVAAVGAKRGVGVERGPQRREDSPNVRWHSGLSSIGA